MTTFKNNAKYAELLLTYLDVAYRGDTAVTVEEVLRTFEWRFKGGSLQEASMGTRLKPGVSGDSYPDGSTGEILAQWPNGPQASALRVLLSRRRAQSKLRSRAVVARLGTYMMLTSTYDVEVYSLKVFTGMRAIYWGLGKIWAWSLGVSHGDRWDLLEDYTKEVMVGACASCKVHLPSAELNRQLYWQVLSNSRVPGLLQAIRELKEVIRSAGARTSQNLSRKMGIEEMESWGEEVIEGMDQGIQAGASRKNPRYIGLKLGPLYVRVTQSVVLLNTGETRFALGKSDMERLHQVLMSAASALVGVVAQAAVGTSSQKVMAQRAVEVADANIQRIVLSAGRVPLGDEVLVCKGYRRAYTAVLGVLSGPLCANETVELIKEAMETAAPGVLDIEGMIDDARTLDAASALNASKMFKICPAPDVSPGSAMIDRIKQIGDGNVANKLMMPSFEFELKTQILRAYIRQKRKPLKLRNPLAPPSWYVNYVKREFDQVPSAEIDTHLIWEGTAEMPRISKYNPGLWKDSGLGADDRDTAMRRSYLGYKSNMITRLLYDDDCPMPGRVTIANDHVIKFFVKAEGHKEPARGIFSANLTDRQAQSWMEMGVEQIAKYHPSYMIGQEVDVRDARVAALTTRPDSHRWVALYYSFDISGWSAKMPREPQMISHKIWGELYGGHLFTRAHEINEGAFIYLNMDGYLGWFENTHANLEGFNGKEMTMVLVAMLSLSVRRWRVAVAEAGLMPLKVAEAISVMLFAYIDDGLSRIDLPRDVAVEAFEIYKKTVIDTFYQCGFTVEVSKCFPSDRFAIFLNEVYIGGRHVVHGVRAAMAISSEPTERHTSLVERVTSVTTGCRGAVMAGLNPLSAVFLMSYHCLLHLEEWCTERDPVILAIWSMSPRTWGGLGMPNIMQMFVSGSGAAFEEGVATMQAYAKRSTTAKVYFLRMLRTELQDRTHMSVLTAPLSGRVVDGYMVDSRVSSYVRLALQEAQMDGRLSRYAERLLRYSDTEGFRAYAESVIPLNEMEVLQEQMIDNIAEAHPHGIFAAFARRMEKSVTVRGVLGMDLFIKLTVENRVEAQTSVSMVRVRLAG